MLAELRHRDAAQGECRRVVAQGHVIEGAERVAGDEGTRRGGDEGVHRPEATASAARASHCGLEPHRRRPRLKTYDIEMQRLKSMKHDKGVIEFGVDVLVLPRPARDDHEAASSLRLPVEHARSLLILLKQQLAELDKLQPRSRRSGRN